MPADPRPRGSAIWRSWRPWHRGLLIAAGICVATWIGLRLVVPRLIIHYGADPILQRVPKRTTNKRNIPGDPINVALIGTPAELVAALDAAGWVPADPLTRRSALQIAESVVLHRPDSTAPVSPLFLYRRKQDFAFEREVGRSASERHHVRLWRADDLTIAGRPLWIGDATFDAHAGLSRRGLHPTHHIAPDVDRERDTLFANLATAGQLVERSAVTGVGLTADGHNAEGDRYSTDGEIWVGVLSPRNAPHGAPVVVPDPPLAAFVLSIWHRLHGD